MTAERGTTGPRTAPGSSDVGKALEGFCGELRPIAEEVHRIWWWALISGRVHLESNRLWRVVNWVTSGAASMLAAATGASALADLVGRVWIGAGSLLAAVLTAAASVASAKERAILANGSRTAYIELRDAARQLLQIDLVGMDRMTARAALSELTARYHTVNQQAEPHLQIARWLANRALRRARMAGPRTFELNASWPQPLQSVATTDE